MIQIVLVYDIKAEEDKKVNLLSLCRRYLHWIQNSVFEGQLTEGQFKKLKKEINKQIYQTDDSVIIYTFRRVEFFEKETLGIEKGNTSQFL